MEYHKRWSFSYRTRPRNSYAKINEVAAENEDARDTITPLIKKKS